MPRINPIAIPTILTVYQTPRDGMLTKMVNDRAAVMQALAAAIVEAATVFNIDVLEATTEIDDWIELL